MGRKYYDLAIEKEEAYQKYKEQNHPDTKKALANATKDYVKCAVYLDKWNDYRSNNKASAIEWVASTQVIAAKLLQEMGRDDDVKNMYKKALRLFRKCLAKNNDPEKEKDLQIKATECAIETEDWEEAVLVFYPIFQQDRERRKEQKLDDDVLYVDYISRMLTGLSQQNTYKDANALLRFLQERLHLELINDLNRTYSDLSKASHQAIFNDYVRIAGILKEIKGSQLTDGEKQQLEAAYQKEVEARKNITEEEMIERKMQTLERVYFDEYKNLVKSELPLDGKASISDTGKEIKNISLYLAYDATSKLMGRISPYKNPSVRFGSYDNPQWWEVKYRQLLVLFLMGQKKDAKDLIASLRVRHRSMGGEKFQEKFRELEQRP